MRLSLLLLLASRLRSLGASRLAVTLRATLPLWARSNIRPGDKLIKNYYETLHQFEQLEFDDEGALWNANTEPPATGTIKRVVRD